MCTIKNNIIISVLFPLNFCNATLMVNLQILKKWIIYFLLLNYLWTALITFFFHFQVTCVIKLNKLNEIKKFSSIWFQELTKNDRHFVHYINWKFFEIFYFLGYFSGKIIKSHVEASWLNYYLKQFLQY